VGIEASINMKNFYKILERIIYTGIFLVAILLIWSVLPIKNGPKLFVVLSGSMEPAMHTGSVVIIKPETQYKIGDMVTFGKNTSTQIPTTHRIVSTRAQDGVMLFTTKGDANNAPDGAEIRQSDIHGRVLFNISNLGYVIDFIRKPLGMVLIILLPAIFIIYDEVRKIIEEMKKIMAKKKEGDIIIKENV